MSKLIEKIQAHATGRHFAKMPKYDLLNVDTQVRQLDSPRLMEYEIYVALGCTVRLDNRIELNYNPGVEPYREMASMIEQEVFGEFYSGIHRIRQALWNGDTKAGLDLLRELEVQMFSTSMGGGK